MASTSGTSKLMSMIKRHPLPGSSPVTPPSVERDSMRDTKWPRGLMSRVGQARRNLTGPFRISLPDKTNTVLNWSVIEISESSLLATGRRDGTSRKEIQCLPGQTE